MTAVVLRYAAAFAVLAFLSGCAPVEREDFMALQRQVYQNQQDIKTLSQRVEKARRPQAEMGAEMNTLRREIAQLRGRIEETTHLVGQIPDSSAEVGRLSAESQAKSEGLEKRLAAMEKYLGVKDGKMPPKKKTPPKPSASQAAPSPPKTAKAVYNLGHKLYKQKSYTAARDQWQSLIKKFPKSSLVPSAYFWIGETYYVSKKFEEAILSYNQVVKRYKKSSKAPAALLKQGLSFSALGDKRTAKIVLNKLVKSYPKSSQARQAKKYLAKM